MADHQVCIVVGFPWTCPDKAGAAVHGQVFCEEGIRHARAASEARWLPMRAYGMVEEGAGGASLLIAHDGESSRRDGAYTVWKREGVGGLTAETFICFAMETSI